MSNETFDHLTPRFAVETCCESAAEIHARWGDGTAFRFMRGVFENVGAGQVFDILAEDLRRGEEPRQAVPSALFHGYDCPRLHAGECDAKDLPFFAEHHPDNPMKAKLRLEILR